MGQFNAWGERRKNAHPTTYRFLCWALGMAVFVVIALAVGWGFPAYILTVSFIVFLCAETIFVRTARRQV